MKITRLDMDRGSLQSSYQNNSPEFAEIGLFEGDIERKGKCTTSVGMEGGELSWSYLLSNG